MTLRYWSLVGVAALLLAPLSASALGIASVSTSSSGGNPGLLADGDILTIDIVVENTGNESVFAAGLAIDGYDTGFAAQPNDNRLQFIGGSATGALFRPVPGFGGIANTLPSVVQEGGTGPGDELRLSLFQGVDTIAATGDGLLDPAASGAGTVGDGGVHFTVQFQATVGAVPQRVTLNIGTGTFGNAVIGDGGAVLPFTNASLSVVVVPEPGTALLMGLGLAGLARAARREH